MVSDYICRSSNLTLRCILHHVLNVTKKGEREDVNACK